MLTPVQFLALAFLIVLAHCSSLAGDVLRVPQDVPSIQAAIDSAANGDTVLVADGTYVEVLNFRGKQIVVGSLFLTTGDPGHIAGTVVDAQKQGPTVTFSSGETSACRLVGVTLSGGQSSCGGGIYCKGAGPRLSNIIIAHNVALGGG